MFGKNTSSAGQIWPSGDIQPLNVLLPVLFFFFFFFFCVCEGSPPHRSSPRFLLYILCLASDWVSLGANGVNGISVHPD